MVMVVWICFGMVASAEQQKAEEYRQILQSGTFYIEYADVVNTEAGQHQMLAESNGVRIKWKNEIKRGGGGLLGFIVPFAGLIESKDRVPVTMYKDGKLYQFKDKKSGLVATEEQLRDENINPLENWQYVKRNLSLPEGMQVFSLNDLYNQEKIGTTIPQYENSVTKEIDGKRYEVDTYLSQAKSVGGKTFYSTEYLMCYKDGELERIIVNVLSDGLEPVESNKYIIYKISGELPENIMQLPEGCQVFSAGMGDMNDLIGMPVLIEKY